MLLHAIALLSLVPQANYEWFKVGDGIDAGRPVYVMNTTYHQGKVIAVEQDGIWQSINGDEWKQIARKDQMPGDPPSGALVSDGDNLWVLGTRQAGQQGVTKEIWKSKNGVEWKLTRNTTPGVVGFSRLHNDQLWIVSENGHSWNGTGESTWSKSTKGGWTKPVGAVSFHNKFYVFDVSGKSWTTTDGSRWSEEGSGPWKDRERPQFVATDDELFLVGGYAAKDYWHTRDGRSWQKQDTPREFFPRSLPTPAVTPDGILLVGGKSGFAENSNPSDVWLIRARNSTTR